MVNSPLNLIPSTPSLLEAQTFWLILEKRKTALPPPEGRL
jgi:hypothetical protein